GLNVRQEPRKPWAVHVASGEAAIIVAVLHQRPAFVTLAGSVCGAGFVLRVERVELLLEYILGRFAGVDCAAHDLLSHCGSARRTVARTSARRSRAGRSRSATAMACPH